MGIGIHSRQVLETPYSRGVRSMGQAGGFKFATQFAVVQPQSVYHGMDSKPQFLQIVVTKGFCVLVYNRVGVTGTGWQCLATAGISAEGKELSAKR